jgi:hypothetical protein
VFIKKAAFLVDTSGIIDGAAYAERWADLNVGQRTGGVANTGDVQNEMTIAKIAWV